MLLRPFQLEDAAAVYQLFYETVHSVNLKDYSPAEVEAWVPSAEPDLYKWGQRFLQQDTLIAEINGQMAGFGNLDEEGLNIDMVYTHKDFQGQGVASALVRSLENQVREKGGSSITLAASITARPFFERRGYGHVRDNQVERRGVVLRNFIMRKVL